MNLTEVVAARIRSGGRFLACRRPASKARGLQWEFVGGKVEPGETKEDALVRECREELGVTVAPRGALLTLLHEYPDLTIRLTLFDAVIVRGTPQPLEHCDLRWITLAESENYDFCPADRELLARLRADLSL